MATVLALGGDEHSLLCLQDILEPFGHVVIPISGQAQALQTAQEIHFDLFLLDLLLDGVDAPSLIQAVLSMKPQARILALTSYPKAPKAKQALEAGAFSLMRKPYEIGRILQYLSEIRP